MMKINFKKNLLLAAAALTGATSFGQGACNEFSYFYSDINYPDGVKQSDIYNVDLEDGSAILTPISLDLAYGAHIALDEASGLLILVNDNNGEIQTLDPITGELGTPISPEINLSGIVTVAHSPAGHLLIGGGNGIIYNVDLGSDPYGVAIFDEGADISGGDLTFSENGLYLAAKPNGNFYTVLPGMSNIMLGSVEGSVTGMATLADQSGVVVSSRNNSSFITYNVDGTVTESGSYEAILDGEPFTLDNGDMASGCMSRSSSINDCDNFKTYYIHDAEGGGADVLYSVELNNAGGANLMEIATLGSSSHLGVAPNGLLYVVRGGTKILTIIDPETANVLDEVQLIAEEGNLANIPAVVVGDDGTLYVGTSADKIYSVNIETGMATQIGSANVAGGDLVFIDGALWLANRTQNRFYEIGGEGQFDVAATEINGVATLSNGNLLIANGNSNTLFEVYEPYTGEATGETFSTGLTLFNGDLASRCFDINLSNEDCENYKVYLSDNSTGDGHLYEVALDDETMVANLSLLRDELPKSHIALAQNGLVYLIGKNGSIATYDPATDVLGAYLPITLDGENINGTHSGVVAADGTLYVGHSSADKVYQVDPLTGIATNPVDAPVQGGDMIQTENGDIWVINRSESRFYNITDGVTEYDVDLNQIFGAAVLANGMIIVGTANSGQISLVDPNTQASVEAVYAMDLMMGGGDLAAGCVTGDLVVIPEPGDCYATEVIEYLPGTSYSGGSIPEMRLDPTQALGAPERTDDFVFATLGYSEEGGSITLGFGGLVPNNEGDDIEIVETTFGENGCDSYPEFADVYVSQDGVNFFFAKQVCRYNPFVDISDAGEFDYVMYIKIVEAVNSTSIDGFDVDGVVALHNCDETGIDQGEEPVIADNATVSENVTLSSYPNPTEGQTTVTFSTSNDDFVTLQVLDMNGRVVTTLLNQDVKGNVNYNVDFNGLSLPNGLYVTKLTTNTETVVNKMLISK